MSFKSSANRLLRTILGFKELKITDHDLLPRKGVLHLWVKPHKNGARCPHCGRRGKLLGRGPRHAARDRRTWRDIATAGLATVLHYSPREITCETHGRVQEDIPWAVAKARITLRLECQILRMCKAMTQKEAAAQLGLPTSTLAGLLHAAIKRHRAGHKIRGIKELGIDEISYKKGQKYLTVVYDLARRHVVWVGKGKGRETIDRFFAEHMSPGQRARVQVACCDMSATYMGAIEDHLPGALLVLDRFHIAKALNEAVDEVRKEAWRAASAADKKPLKGLRFILLKNRKNRTRREHKLLAGIERTQRHIFRACQLKDELAHFWDYSYIGSAEKFLKRWSKSAKLSRLEPLRKFARTLDNNWGAVMASLTGVTNAAAEGINRLIRMARNRASGYRNPENFAAMIYLIAGDLDIPGQIPAKNRPRETRCLPHRELCR
jgi:transposase